MDEFTLTAAAPDAEEEVVIQPVDSARLREFDEILRKYKAGKANLEKRVIAAENWWRLRNEAEEAKRDIGDGNFRSKSAWLHNVIVSKHADMIEAYPEPVILPREPGDRAEADKLSSIVPLVMEAADFEETYSDVCWRKCKSGTGIYKVVWDADKLNGLGDIGIQNVDILSLFWEPGITDIQKSRYVFHCEMQDNELLEEAYPQLKDKLKGNTFTLAKYIYDDNVSTDGKSVVIDVYYKMGGVLHYCKYVGDEVLFSTENGDHLGDAADMMGDTASVGLYDDGEYPFVFDPLFPVEGSPCGYGYVDIGQNPQIQIDCMDTAFFENVMMGASPRYFERIDGAVNVETFLDTRKKIVPVQGNIDEQSLRLIDTKPLGGNYINVYEGKIRELRETSGNTETSAGISTGGVTSASGIAALQEASGKSSRDANKAAYRAYKKIVNMVIERIRQFYDQPRMFRITGQYGEEEFTTYDNSGIVPQEQGNLMGTDLGYRLPVFDISVEAQKKNPYTKQAQNDLAIQLLQLGFFNPQMTDQALMCLQMMEFDGKQELMQRIAQQGTLFQRLQTVAQYAVAMAQKYEPANADALMQSLMGSAPAAAPSGKVNESESKSVSGENPIVERARARAASAPTEG